MRLVVTKIMLLPAITRLLVLLLAEIIEITTEYWRDMSEVCAH